MHHPPLVVDGSPSQVRDRLSKRLLVIRSTWFPTRRELQAWSSSGVPAYVRWLRGGRVEVGPRLESMWAACFSPVLRGRMEPTGHRTTIAWRRSLPNFTIALLGLWATVLLLWAAGLGFQLTQGVVDAGAIFWWAVLALSTLAAPALGLRYGGRALDEAERWVRTTGASAVEEDW